jgi:acyl-CoA dehydrogenase family protein 9
MSARIFLERLLVGDSMTDTITDPFMHMEPDDQTQRLVAQFQEIIGNYSQIMPSKHGALSSEALLKLRKAGFFGLDIPRVFGGIGLNIFQYLRVVESVAALSMDIGITALAHLSIGTKGIVLFGSEEQKLKYLVPAAQGQMIFSYALTEPLHGSDAKHIETTAMWDESADGYILNGRKAYITNANLAKGLTVFAQSDRDHERWVDVFLNREERLHERVMSAMLDRSLKDPAGEKEPIHATFDDTDQKLSAVST